MEVGWVNGWWVGVGEGWWVGMVCGGRDGW